MGHTNHEYQELNGKHKEVGFQCTRFRSLLPTGQFLVASFPTPPFWLLHQIAPLKREPFTNYEELRNLLLAPCRFPSLTRYDLPARSQPWERFFGIANQLLSYLTSFYQVSVRRLLSLQLYFSRCCLGSQVNVPSRKTRDI